MILGSLVIVHDGSYMREVDPHVCSAGFMLYCTQSKNRAKGTVVKKSVDASNYRGKILGGLMVQLVLKAATQRRVSLYAPVRSGL